jgi:hypothetical protein
MIESTDEGSVAERGKHAIHRPLSPSYQGSAAKPGIVRQLLDDKFGDVAA